MTISPLPGTVDRAGGTVHLERTLPAPTHEVWDALTDPARLHAWLAPVQEGQPGPGRNEDDLAAHLTGIGRTADGCDAEDFMAAYRALKPRYAAAATG